MLTRQRFMLALTADQEAYAERVASICRTVWNIGLEQRRAYRERGTFTSYVQQCRELTEAKRAEPWLADAPNQCLQHALHDLDKACRRHGTFKIHWRSSKKWKPSFGFPDRAGIRVERINKRWGRVKLSRFGWLRFRWSRSMGGEIRNAVVLREAGRWYVSFCIEDGRQAAPRSEKPAIGVDRGVVVAVATSDGWLRDRQFITPGEARRLRRARQRVDASRKGSARREVRRAKLGKVSSRVRFRRTDFCAWTANRLASNYGLIVIEDLNIAKMTVSARGTSEKPGRCVRQKAGLNRAILDKGWGRLVQSLNHKARYSGSEVIRVNPAYTSITCSACGIRDAESRESQARFACRSCGHAENADVNAAKNILAAGLAVTGRGDLCDCMSMKRQPPMSAITDTHGILAADSKAEVKSRVICQALETAGRQARSADELSSSGV